MSLGGEDYSATLNILALAWSLCWWSLVPHTKRLWVRFLARVHAGGNQSIFLSLSLSLSLSEINKDILG